MRETVLCGQAKDQSVVCNLCAQRCLIHPGRTGICGVKENRAGVLDTLVYDRVVSMNIDPIEKKPLFHFLPGSTSFSIATAGVPDRQGMTFLHRRLQFRYIKKPQWHNLLKTRQPQL